MKVNFEMYLTNDEAKYLNRIVQDQNDYYEKKGRKADYTIEKELITIITRYLLDHKAEINNQ